MAQRIFVGIDTSNYTTSVSFCDFEGNILKNYKILLPVKEGEKGLRQSDAVFAHIKNIPQIANRIKAELGEYEILALGHSAYPRDCEGSYMPCFLVGEAVSELIASLYNLKSYRFSHQAGHIRAATYSSGVDIKDSFIAFHVSGGTTEILLVQPEHDGYNIHLIGGSNDLHAGQAIDRIGVKMGLKFPCGPKIEELAKKNTKEIPKFKVSVKDFSCNLSGLENLAYSLYEKTSDASLVSAFTLEYIKQTIKKLSENLRKHYGEIKIVYAGGVMSNSIIKDGIMAELKEVYFASAEYSADNAAGIALLTRTKYLNEEV